MSDARCFCTTGHRMLDPHVFCEQLSPESLHVEVMLHTCKQLSSNSVCDINWQLNVASNTAGQNNVQNRAEGVWFSKIVQVKCGHPIHHQIITPSCPPNVLAVSGTLRGVVWKTMLIRLLLLSVSVKYKTRFWMSHKYFECKNFEALLSLNFPWRREKYKC